MKMPGLRRNFCTGRTWWSMRIAAANAANIFGWEPETVCGWCWISGSFQAWDEGIGSAILCRMRHTGKNWTA